MENIPEEQNIKSEKHEQETEDGMKYHEIAELEDPVRKILEQILPRIESGDYSLILGDDASGRIPTRIFEKFINAVYDLKGFEHPEVRFIAGSSGLSMVDRMIKQKQVRKHLEQNIPEHNQRALIVTDTISSGASVRVLTHALRKLGIQFDVATVSLVIGFPESDTREFNTEKKEVEWLVRGKIFNGTDRVSDIYGNPLISGVRKKTKDIVSEPVARGNEDDQQLVNDARDDAFAVADRLLDWYNKQKEGEK